MRVEKQHYATLATEPNLNFEDLPPVAVEEPVMYKTVMTNE